MSFSTTSSNCDEAEREQPKAINTKKRTLDELEPFNISQEQLQIPKRIKIAAPAPLILLPPTSATSTLCRYLGDSMSVFTTNRQQAPLPTTTTFNVIVNNYYYVDYRHAHFGNVNNHVIHNDYSTTTHNVTDNRGAHIGDDFSKYNYSGAHFGSATRDYSTHNGKKSQAITTVGSSTSTDGGATSASSTMEDVPPTIRVKVQLRGPYRPEVAVTNNVTNNNENDCDDDDDQNNHDDDMGAEDVDNEY